MGYYKSELNPFTGQLQLVPTNVVLNFKAGVASQANLPLSGNSKGDARIANDTGHLYVWSIEASSGLLTDWADSGDITDLNWAAISDKPTSSVENIDDAVTKKHTQNTDQYLDYGGANQIAVNEVTKRLTSPLSYYINPDTGDDGNDGSVGSPFRTIQHAINILPDFFDEYPVTIYLQDSLNYAEQVNIKGRVGTGELSIRSQSNDATKVLIQFPAPVIMINGVSFPITFNRISVRVAGNSASCIWANKNCNITVLNCRVGDNNNSNTNGIYCTNNSVAYVSGVTDIDENKVSYGVNSHTGSKIAVESGTSFSDYLLGNWTSGIVTVGNMTIINTDYTYAIDKKHSQNTDQYLDFGGANQAAVADVKDAVDKKHTQNTDSALRTDKLVVLEDGKVGIGISNPAADFVVAGANGTTLLAGYQYPSAWSAGLLVRINDISGVGWGYELIPGIGVGYADFRIRPGVVDKTGTLGGVGNVTFQVSDVANVGIGDFSEVGTKCRISNNSADDRKLLVLRPNAAQTKNSIEWQDKDGNLLGGVSLAGEIKIKVYEQASEPTISTTEFMAVWIDSDDSYRTYLLFKRGFKASGLAEQVAVELT